MNNKTKHIKQQVYVLNQHNKPLMPTSPAHARQLLKQGKAEIVDFYIFTIRLTCWSDGYKQPITLGIDSGKAHIGACASTEKSTLMLLEMNLRTDIVEKISTRRMCRNDRRYRKTRYRKARWLNRVKSKKKGWLPPSVNYVKEKHKSLINLIHKKLPITKIRVEVCNFDIQKIKNPDIQGLEYQQGEQLDSYNVREYVLSRDGHKCTNCFGKSGDKVLEVHHIESRKTGGNAPNNLRTLCHTCHTGYHQGIVKLKLMRRGTSFRDSAVVNSFKWQLLDELKQIYPNVEYTFGYITKHKRINKHLRKEHYFDAYCIANNLEAMSLESVYKCRCFRRHNRSLHVMMFKKGHKRRKSIAPYWLDKNQTFTRYDRVICNSVQCFISGSTRGRACVKDIEGKKTAGVDSSIHTKNLKLINHAKYGCMIELSQITNSTIESTTYIGGKNCRYPFKSQT